MLSFALKPQCDSELWPHNYYVSLYTNSITSGTSVKNKEKYVAVYIFHISVSLKQSPIIGIYPNSLTWYIFVEWL